MWLLSFHITATLLLLIVYIIVFFFCQLQKTKRPIRRQKWFFVSGLIAAIHLISVHRRDFKWYMTIFYALLLVIFYPLIPTLALLAFLWAKKSTVSAFKDAQYKATMAQAVRGSIGTPIQLIYQAQMTNTITWNVLKQGYSQLRKRYVSQISAFT